jgi:hypothetical protein
MLMVSFYFFYTLLTAVMIHSFSIGSRASSSVVGWKVLLVNLYAKRMYPLTEKIETKAKSFATKRTFKYPVNPYSLNCVKGKSVELVPLSTQFFVCVIFKIFHFYSILVWAALGGELLCRRPLRLSSSLLSSESLLVARPRFEPGNNITTGSRSNPQ